jgi:cystathionine beta-lyase
MKFATKAIHQGVEPDSATGAIMTPIYQTSTFVQSEVGVHKGYEYSRSKNPTRKALEDNIAAIENGQFGLAFGSGMAAIDCVLKTLKPGDEVITSNDLYGGTYRLFTSIFTQFGIKFTFMPFHDLEAVAAAISSNTKMVWIETPTNPTLTIVDIDALATITKQKGTLLAVDNTFASPFLQNPLDLGADLVMHSATKYLAGHSDVVMGALVVNDTELANNLYRIQNSSGAICGPMDSFLVLRGIKTLHLRMQRHSENAMKIAQYLKQHPLVGKVYYPGLEDHPGHAIAKKQMHDFGGMLSFDLKSDDLEMTKKIVANTKLFYLAESLGGVESLIGHPATMTHAAVPREERIASGISDSLIRISVGIEDIDDLIEDLKQAMKL